MRCCEAELALNRRTAPKLYVAVRRIAREADGRLALDGAGQLVDAVVEMRRFEDRNLFDSLAQHDELTPAVMTHLARRIAYFHKLAETSRARGGAAAIGRVLDMNEQGLSAASLFPTSQANELTAGFREALRQLGPLLDRRREQGKVRRCHGDLILRNICLFENEPTLFDCLEFDEDLATIDVLYDLAFLLMDFWHRTPYSSSTRPDGTSRPASWFLGDIEHTPGAVRRLVTKLAGKYHRLLFCYEAGPTGYGLQRQISDLGHDCAVIAPSLIPKRPGERVKTNRRDALTLARLHRAGELTAIWVPDPGHEAVRDLVRARKAAMEDLREKRQHLQAFLLWHGRIYPGLRPWTQVHARWLPNLSFAHPAQYLDLREYRQAIEDAEARLERLTQQVSEVVSSWSI